MNGVIYGLCSSEDEVIKYIGQTTTSLKNRLSGHLYNYNNKVNNKKNNWIKFVLNNGFEVKIIEIDYFHNIHADELDFWESYYINQFTCWGYELKNGTLGGKSGRKVSKRKKTKEETLS